MSKINYVTETGYAKLQEKLNGLYKEREEALEQMKDAMSYGGELSENSEYLMSKETVDRLENRINEIQERQMNSKIIYKNNIANDDVVRFGKTVKLLDLDTNEEFTYMIVGEDEADLKLNKISHTSPIGKALCNQKEGECVYFETPKGDREIEILKVFIA